MSSRVKTPSYNTPAQSGKTALMLGAGYTARALIPVLQARGYAVSATIHETRVNMDGVAEINCTHGLTPDLKHAFETADIVVSSIPPFKQDAPASKMPGGGLADPAVAMLSGLTPRARWIGYLSATSVYGDLGGGWADENTAVRPSLKRGKQRAEAEMNWIETGWPVHIFRLAGIYGPGRNPLERIQSGRARAVIKHGHIVNRIHVDDITRALLASMEAPNPQAIYNIADGNPAPPQDVLFYAAQLLGLPAPKSVSVHDPEVSQMARTFYAETKRIDISRARAQLGWEPKYPNYQAGLDAILADMRASPLL